MKRYLLSILTLAAALVCANAQPRGGAREFPEAKPSKGVFEVVKQDTYVPTVSYRKDVVYATKDGKDLHLQILTPSMNQRKPLPCILYVQGSAWMKQDLYSCVPKMAQFASRGYVVAVVEYRDTGIAPFPAQTVDAKTAIRYVRKNARRLNVDVNNIFIWGDSSGGHTSLMVAVSQDDPAIDDSYLAEESCAVNAAIAYYPPTDISVMKDYPSENPHNDPTSPEGLLIGGVEVASNQAAAKKASPLYYVSKDKPLVPIFMAAGTMDRTVPFSQTDLMAGKLQECGKTYEYYALQGADHGTWQFWTDEMYDKVEAFIKKNLK
ncbi:MAG: alpha/beta hydrolase [Bacteroidales bacterium]|nr:alpha/beta hydrolase [Bacteroidales bacterium]